MSGATPLFTVHLAFTDQWWLQVDTGDWIGEKDWPELLRMFTLVVEGIERLNQTEVKGD